MKTGYLWGIGAALVASLLWGTTGTAATFAPSAGPLAIGAAALGIGGILQALVALPALARSRGALWQQRSTVLIGAAAVAIYPLAFYSSMHHAGVAVGSVVSLASAPLASGLLEKILDRRRLGPWWITAAMLGIIGSILLCTYSDSPHSTGSSGTLLGVALGLVAGTTYATYSWAVQRLLTGGIGRAAAMGSVFGIGGVLLMPVLALTGAPLLATPQAFTVAAYMAIVPMFLGYYAFGYALTRIPASTATTITLTEPAIATILAVLILHEHLTVFGWIGLGIFAIALAILALAPRPTAHDDQHPSQRTQARITRSPSLHC